MNLKITIDVNGENRVYLFGEVTDITIGRDDDNLISPIIESISRHHAKIFFKDSEWFVQDLDSTNGSFLNDAKLEKIEKLSQGDKLRFGDLKCVISLGESAGVKEIPAPAAAPVVPDNFEAPAVAVVDDIPDLPAEGEKVAAIEPPKAASPISPISPIKPVLKKPVLGGGLKSGLKLPPKPVAGLKPGLKLPGKPDATAQ